MTTAALIVAAGRGTRATAHNTSPKQYLEIGGRALLVYAIQPFLDHPAITAIHVVIHPDDEKLYRATVSQIHDPSRKLQNHTFGGATRQNSVLNGLESLAPTKIKNVLIHDAARPFVRATTITAICDVLNTKSGVIAATPLADTLKRLGSNGTIAETVPRINLWRAQTPQGFRLPDILDAHRKAARVTHSDFTDDASVAEWAGVEVDVVETPSTNTKITTAEDVALAQQLLPARQTRIGSGYDVHKLGPGDKISLCGLEIPFGKGLIGHSDADVGLHALTDAILGAISAGDIGTHFPPSDAKWKDAASDQFLEHAADLVRQQNGTISNVDITLICEAPKIGPMRNAMRQRIADILAIDVSQVSVKATTTERLGFTGRGEGIAAMATAAVLVPAPTT